MKNGVVTIKLTKDFAPEDGQDQVQMLRAIVQTALAVPRRKGGKAAGGAGAGRTSGPRRRAARRSTWTPRP